ncbi:MAG: hypothetical protein AB7G21_06880 [Dehalococcoidia bacterium]
MASDQVMAALHEFEVAHRALRDRVSDGDLVSIEDSPNVAYVIWPDGRLAYTNRAFRAFAEENGASALPTAWGLGRSVFDAMRGEIAAFYREHWSGIAKSGPPWEHTYECSSADEFRLFHMITFPLPGDLGLLLVVNSLAYAGPHSRPESRAVESRYRDADGIILQCANCRRVRALESDGAWHWVPAWVRQPPQDTSHGICSVCVGAYYSPLLRRRQLRDGEA